MLKPMVAATAVPAIAGFRLCTRNSVSASGAMAMAVFASSSSTD
jgi:hypothetical protein